MPDTPDYAIIVPAYNEEAQLPRTLPAMLDAMAGVLEDTGAQGELIVVDNNSSDKTAQVAQALGAKVVFEPENMIAKARNAGAKASAAPRLVFVDADTTLSVELLGATLNVLAQADCCGGGATLVFEPYPGFIAQRLLGLWNTASCALGWPAGCYFFCRRDAFEDVGGFGENLYASEEVWLARKLKKWGRTRPAGQTKMTMLILPNLISTSSRKLDNPLKMFGMLVLMFLFPFAVRFKGLCGYWYKRQPEEA